MKNFIFKYTILGITILSFFIFSCSSELDFNQTDDLVLKPVIVSNLASFTILANQLVTGGIEQVELIDVPNFDLFKELYFKENLTKVAFNFEFNNTIKRDFVVDLVLLDADDNLLYTISIPISAYSGTKKLVTQEEVFESNLAILYATRKMFFRISMLPGSSLNESSSGSLSLRSNIVAYFEIE